MQALASVKSATAETIKGLDPTSDSITTRKRKQEQSSSSSTPTHQESSLAPPSKQARLDRSDQEDVLVSRVPSQRYICHI